jgi:hypothetical protein
MKLRRNVYINRYTYSHEKEMPNFVALPHIAHKLPSRETLGEWRQLGSSLLVKVAMARTSTTHDSIYNSK